MISVRIWGFVCDQSQYAYGESYNPRMHTGTVIIPPRMHKVIAGVAISVYSRGCPYAYCESPYAYSDPHTHVHSGLILYLQRVHESNNDYWLMTTSFYNSLQQSHSNSLLFKQHLLFLWQRELQSLPAFLQAQLFDVHSPLQLHFTIP
jgi:hypothetical protein